MTRPTWQTDILAGGELFRVGGRVRDRLLGVSYSSSDTDFLVRGIPPDRLEGILRSHGSVVLVGRSFGVYRFTESNGPTYDIVYPRTERSTGPGHRDFDVQWDWRLSVEEDLRRRDFTVNAIAEDVRDGRIVDPVGGTEDIDARVLRMIFPRAFEEDPLRILRGVRFHAQLDLSVDPATRDAMRDAAPLLSALSPERVQEEFTRILTRCAHPSAAFRLAHDIGALGVVLPELDRCAGIEQNEYHPDDVFEHSLKTVDAAPPENLAVRWAALMHDVGKVDRRREVEDHLGKRVVFYGHEDDSADMIARAMNRMRYSGELVARCRHLVQQHMFHYDPEWTDATVRRFMRRIGPGNLDDQFLLREADCRSRSLDDGLERLAALRARVERERATRSTISVSDLAIDGRDVMDACGLEPGPEVGKLLEQALEHVLDTPGENDRGVLLGKVREWHLGAKKNRKPK